MELLFDAGAIIIADLILSGDNALIIGMAAAGLAPELRARAIMFGMVIAAVLRIVFAVIAAVSAGDIDPVGQGIGGGYGCTGVAATAVILVPDT